MDYSRFNKQIFTVLHRKRQEITVIPDKSKIDNNDSVSISFDNYTYFNINSDNANINHDIDIELKPSINLDIINNINISNNEFLKIVDAIADACCIKINDYNKDTSNEILYTSTNNNTLNVLINSKSLVDTHNYLFLVKVDDCVIDSIDGYELYILDSYALSKINDLQLQKIIGYEVDHIDDLTLDELFELNTI